jgi:transposase
MKCYYVYGIFVNSVIIYVGKGKGNRKDQHLKNFLLHNTAVNRVLKAKLSNAHKNNDKIEIKILVDDLTEDDALLQEFILIETHGKKIDQQGTLCNITNGGHQPPSADIIRKAVGDIEFKKIKEKQVNTMKLNMDKKIQAKKITINNMLTAGKMLKEIAHELNVSPATIRNWIRRSGLQMNYTGKENKIKQHLQKYRQINNQKPNCNAKLYIIKEPSGNLYETRLLKQYCKLKNIDYSNLRATFKRGGSHKGYSIVTQQEPETL